MKELLKVPTEQEYVEQKNLLRGEQCDNWVDFNTQVKKHLETEVMLHQVSNAIELGWEPATESKPGLLSQDKKLRGKYLLTTKKLMVQWLEVFQQQLIGLKRTSIKGSWQPHKKPSFQQ